MKKLFFTLCMIALGLAAYSQSENARVRSDDMNQPEIDNLSGAKPDVDDLSPQNAVTSYSTGGDQPLVMDKPEDDESSDPSKGTDGQLPPVDLSSATIYPNPANDYIVVSSEATIGYIRILNLLGQEMMVVQINNTENYVDIAPLNEGIYFVSIESGDQKIVKKIKVLS